MSSKLVVVVAGVLLMAGYAWGAGIDPDLKCRAARGKAASLKAFAIMNAWAKNITKPDEAKLTAAISKAQSNFTKQFTAPVAKGWCDPVPQVKADDVGRVIDPPVDCLVRLAIYDEPCPPPPPGCGNGVIETRCGEECDTTDDGKCPGQCRADCTCPPPPCDFPATGQTGAYQADKNDGIPGLVWVPDDGSVKAGAPLAYVDNGDGTITDLNTGLMWEKKSDDGTPHDKDNYYWWSGYDGSQETIWDWLDDVNAEGGTGFAGHSDWRIPNVKELQSIIDYGQSNPSVDPVFDTGCTVGCTVTGCSCTQVSSSYHWSSTTDDTFTNTAWMLQFVYGYVLNGDKVNIGYVRAVRDGSSLCPLPATGQTGAYQADKNDGIPGLVWVPDDGSVKAGAPLAYVDNGDGTITDLNTGLMWEKKSDDGTPHDKDNYYFWSGYDGSQETIWDWLDDVNAEGGTGFAGHSDWRIPNVKELQSIIDYGQSNPSVDPVFDTGCTVGCTVTGCSCTQVSSYYYHWSSTTADTFTNTAWMLQFIYGYVLNSDKVVNIGYVRAVRGGGV